MVRRGARGGGSLAGEALGALLDAVGLVGPVTLVRLDPLVHGLELLGLEAVEALAAAGGDGDEPGFPEDGEVLGDGGLGEVEEADKFADGGGAAVGEGGDDVAPAGLGDGAEGVGRGRGAGAACAGSGREKRSTRRATARP